jgi:hypothetical protein
VSISVLEAQRAVARPALRVSSVTVEIVAVAAIVVTAAIVRWPELMVVPRFTDESSEILLGVSIARGEALPLVNWHPHIGAAFNYLVAAALLIAGPTIEAGRLVVWLLGALTTVPTYLLGRSIGGPAVGSLAALFLATSGTHIVVSSHIAYSHSLVPLFSTLGLWLIHRSMDPHGLSHQHGAAARRDHRLRRRPKDDVRGLQGRRPRQAAAPCQSPTASPQPPRLRAGEGEQMHAYRGMAHDSVQAAHDPARCAVTVGVRLRGRQDERD